MKKNKSNPINISPSGDSWHAWIAVPRKDLAKLKGVRGAMSDGGAWIGAFGDSPEHALAELYKEIGKTLLPYVAAEGSPE